MPYLEPTTLDGIFDHTWTELDITDDCGVPYSYTVDEVEVPENYKKQ